MGLRLWHCLKAALERQQLRTTSQLSSILLCRQTDFFNAYLVLQVSQLKLAQDQAHIRNTYEAGKWLAALLKASALGFSATLDIFSPLQAPCFSDLKVLHMPPALLAQVAPSHPFCLVINLYISVHLPFPREVLPNLLYNGKAGVAGAAREGTDIPVCPGSPDL